MKREGIDEALAKCNILRQVKTIQISSSIKFVSIEFDTPTTVETFCFEPLALKDNFSRYFHTRLSEPNKKPIKYTYIRLLYVPSVQTTTYKRIDQYAHVEGPPGYPEKKYGKIEYQTGTRICKVSNIINDIPCYVSAL